MGVTSRDPLELLAAYWEHRWIATQLAIALAEPHELEQHDRRLWLRPPGARNRRRIDVVYNRTSTDRLDSPLGQLVLEPLRAGTLGMVNAFGARVADDKLTHAYVEDMVRFYVSEEPALPSVQTLDLGRPEVLEEALDHFDELVIKPRRGYGGIGVVICRDAAAADVEAARQAVRAHPAVRRAAPGLSIHSPDRRPRPPCAPARRSPSLRVPGRTTKPM
jgi:uncharacterized circularly permuted ATP-grasp superfamily protein